MRYKKKGWWMSERQMYAVQNVIKHSSVIFQTKSFHINLKNNLDRPPILISSLIISISIFSTNSPSHLKFSPYKKPLSR